VARACSRTKPGRESIYRPLSSLLQGHAYAGVTVGREKAKVTPVSHGGRLMGVESEGGGPDLLILSGIKFAFFITIS